MVRSEYVDESTLLLCCENHITHVDLVSKSMKHLVFSNSGAVLITAVAKESSSFILADDNGDLFYYPFASSTLRPVAFPLVNASVACALAADSTHLFVFCETGFKWLRCDSPT